MSTSLDERPGASVPPPAPARESRRRAKDFGLDVKRLRRVRIIVFAILGLPILALVLLAAKFVSMPIAQATHLDAYGEQDYPTAIERLAPVEVANWFEPYLPHLSEGTALLQQGEDAAAEEELRVALDEWTSRSDLNAPMHAQCKILNNLAISIERQADEIEDPQARADRLFEAEELLAPCAGGGGGGEGEGEGGGSGGGEGQDEGEDESSGGEDSGNEDSETTGENGERVEEKRREADEEAGNDPDARESEQGEDEGGEGDEEGGTPQQQDPGDPSRNDPEGDGPDEEAPTDGPSEEDDKDDELEQRNRDAQGGDGGDETGGAPQDPERPW